MPRKKKRKEDEQNRQGAQFKKKGEGGAEIWLNFVTSGIFKKRRTHGATGSFNKRRSRSQMKRAVQRVEWTLDKTWFGSRSLDRFFLRQEFHPPHGAALPYDVARDDKNKRRERKKSASARASTAPFYLFLRCSGSPIIHELSAKKKEKKAKGVGASLRSGRPTSRTRKESEKKKWGWSLRAQKKSRQSQAYPLPRTNTWAKK